MSALVLATFSDASALRAGMDEIKKLHDDASIKLSSLAVVARGPDGKLSVQEPEAERLGAACVGALIGGLAGLPLGPVAAIIGSASGALIGTSAEVVNRHDENRLIDEISREISPGTAAIVAELDEAGQAALEAAMERTGGTTVRK